MKLMTQRHMRHQLGVTLIELMIGVVLGLLLVAVAGAAFITQSNTTRATDESSRLQETARVAMNSLERTIRMAGFVSYGEGSAAPVGFCGATATTTDSAGGDPPVPGPFIEGRSGSGHLENSDRLVLRFYGAGADTLPNGDGSVRDCRGVSVPGQPSNNTVNTFYVDRDPDNEPALFCSVRIPGSTGASTAQALIPGVESFQIVFAVTNGVTSEPRQLLSAGEITDWRRVVAVKISVMLRGDIGSRSTLDVGPTSAQDYYDMFDADYTTQVGSADAGAKLTPATLLTDAERRRLRRVFSSTIELRNSPATLCP